MVSSGPEEPVTSELASPPSVDSAAEDSVLEDVLLSAVEEFPPPPQPATVRIMDAAMTAARAFKREFLDFILCLLKECFVNTPCIDNLFYD